MEKDNKKKPVKKSTSKTSSSAKKTTTKKTSTSRSITAKKSGARKTSTTTKSKTPKSTTKKTVVKKEVTPKKEVISPIVVEEKKVSEKKSIVKEISSNKKLLALLIVVIIGIFLILFNGKSMPKISGSNLDIKYEKDQKIELSNVKKGTVYTNKVVISNNTDKDKYYEIYWKDVTNNFKEQNRLLYELDTSDQDAAYVGKSQLPIADFTLFEKITIKKKSKHTYNVSVYFTGDPNKEKKNTFEGKIEFKQIDK